MNTENPLVSILIPVYNREKYIGEAIESAINQTYKKILRLLLLIIVVLIIRGKYFRIINAKIRGYIYFKMKKI